MRKTSILNKFLYLLAFVLLLSSCSDDTRDTGRETPRFHNDIVLKTTPVKNQGRSPLCWVYAMLATIESERLGLGDSVNLSPDYLARLWLQDQARTYYLTQGHKAVSLRGMAMMTIDLMTKYGIEPYDNYFPSKGINYNVLSRTAMQVARASTSLSMLDQRLGDILDKNVGYLPPMLFMLGMPYTPHQFAESVCLPGDYVALTSFTHHPFGRSFVLESPDNILLDTYYNIPIDKLMKTITDNLHHGHPVCWEGDVSEPGFDFKHGIAILADESGSVTQQTRQRELERFRTTDDHCMELCGIAHDSNGKLYFIAKNSWGKNNPYGGFMYLSYNYVKMKTIAVVTKKNR